MKLHLERIYTCDSYTIGHLYQVLPSGKEKLICDTIEDCDRGLDDEMLEKDIKEQPHMWLWSHKRWSFRREDYLRQKQA
mgnify:CR=1 FL=1